MQGIWSESRWAIDGDSLLLPTGRRIALKQIRQWQTDTIDGRLDLCGKWPGWRIRQQFLIAPGGSMRRGRISENYLRHIVQEADWDRLDLSRRQLDLL